MWHTWRQPSVSLMFLPHFGVFCELLLNRRTATWNLFVQNKTTTAKPFFFRIFHHNPKAGLAHFGGYGKKSPFDVIRCLHKMKQSHLLLCVAKNCDWSLKNEPLSILTRNSLLVEMKTYFESRIELRNIQTINKMLQKRSQVLSLQLPCEPTSQDVALNVAGAKK